MYKNYFHEKYVSKTFNIYNITNILSLPLNQSLNPDKPSLHLSS